MVERANDSDKHYPEAKGIVRMLHRAMPNTSLVISCANEAVPSKILLELG